MPEPWLTRSLLVFMGLYASLRGDEPERLVSLLLIASAFAFSASRLIFGDPEFYTVYPGGVVIDVWLLIGLVWVALRANRAWTLWVGSLQILIVIGHFSKLFDVNAARRAYYVMVHIPFLLQMLVVMLGCWAYQRRVRRIGWHHGWRIS